MIGLAFVAFVVCCVLPVAYLLATTLGADAVCLEGEEARRDAVKLRAHWTCSDEETASFRVAANQDSFPEISRRTIEEYAREIARITSGYFLSINHESEHPISSGGARHLVVPRLLERAPGFRRLSRAPYWLRRGYVEELYRVQAEPPA